jgi:hypothetical protein
MQWPMSYVYWAYDLACGDVRDTGYVGVTEDPHQRLGQLRSAGTVPKHALIKIPSKGTREECLARERRLRPRKNIGWNRAVGGWASEPHRHGRAPIGREYCKDLWAQG